MPRDKDSWNKGCMTIKELKEAIKDAPDDYIINMEGCDCYGFTGSVSINEEEKEVFLARIEGQ